MRFAAIGKYSSFLQESTQVVAGESFFSSNYLQQVESLGDITAAKSTERMLDNGGLGFFVTIGTWNKYDHSIPLDIRNYNNKLKYNALEEQNTFFYVTADLFTDDACTDRATAMEEELDLAVNVIYETGGDAYGQVGTIQPVAGGPVYPVSLIPGGGRHEQRIQLRVTTGGEDQKVEASALYVRVAANIIPLSDLDKINFTEPGGEAAELATSTGSVYTQMLGGIFGLGSGSATADIECWAEPEEQTLKVTLYVACSGMEFQTAAKARMYYQSSNFEYGSETYPRISVNNDEERAMRAKFMRDNFYEEGMSDEEWAEIEAQSETYDTYIEFEVKTANLKPLIFLTKEEGVFSEDFYRFGLVIDDEA